MNGEFEVVLPGGYWIDGECFRNASLRPLCGWDEAFLLGSLDSMRPASWTTQLLTRCLIRLGPLDKVTADIVKALNIGDREALLLHLRRITLGDRLECVLTCPFENCKEKMDLSLKVRDLLSPSYEQTQFWHNISVVEDGRAYDVCFRLPNGGDQEAAAFQAETSLKTAADLILSRCIKKISTDGSVALDNISSAVFQHLSKAMAGLDPQAEIVLNLICPVCGRSFSTVFDAAGYLASELTNSSNHLYTDVHMLAFYYKWSEAEIMGIASNRRRQYVELLENALEAAR